ncbi:MAG TPA: phospholipase [Thermoanaerobaculia bacterium]|nr:phospholipase [Thermoanaerobaculia bacterium]
MSGPSVGLQAGPHAGQLVVAAGRPPAEAAAAVILVHGRGGTAKDILTLVPELDRPDLAYLAPQAAGSSWYPYGFMAPLEQNEPGLSSGLAVIGELLATLAPAGIGPDRTMLLGFSQGACLALEFAARAARTVHRFGAVVGLSGGLIGAPGTPRDYAGSLDGTPVLLGCSDRDPHIPLPRVRETARVMAELGARVSEQIYPAMGHIINADEIERVRLLLDQLAA